MFIFPAIQLARQIEIGEPTSVVSGVVTERVVRLWEEWEEFGDGPVRVLPDHSKDLRFCY